MTAYTWKQGFNIGIADLDQQHRTFVECLNDCIEQVARDRRTTIDRDLVERLKAYAAKHFRYEERVMHANNCPEIAEQQKMHAYFEAQVAELKASLSGPGGQPLESFLVFLRDWFLKHIVEQDRRLAAHMK
jgi:hemerythrin-like metal-binding protein